MATAVGVAYASNGGGAVPSQAALKARVKTPHSFTARMCAASRLIESRRQDSLFYEPEPKLDVTPSWTGFSSNYLNCI